MRDSRKYVSLAFFLVVVLCCAGPCAADSVLLRNGDRLTGEIRKVENQRLKLKTAYAGTLEIDWAAIDSIESDQPFDVQVESGMKLRGTLERGSGAVHVVSGDERVAVAPLTVVAIEPVPEGDETPWRHVEGSADIGYSLTGGNSKLVQESFNFTAKYQTSRHKVQSEIASLVSRQSDAPSTSRHAGSLRYDFSLTPRAFTFALSSFERDERQRLNLRTNLGGGFGWRVIAERQRELSIMGGSTYVNEQFREEGVVPGTPLRNSSSEGLLQIDFRNETAGRTVISSSLAVHPNYFELGRYRITFDSGLRIPLMGPVNWNIRLYDRFDSKPPLDVKKNDYGLISGLGVTF